MIKRIYVEKKDSYAADAKKMLVDLKENLHLEQLEKIRIINRYDVSGLKEDSYNQARFTIFAEPAVDYVYDENLDTQGGYCFAVEYLPGQYDQRADSAVQCLKLMDSNLNPQVKFATVYILYGNISEVEIEKIKAYCINPVDSHEAQMDKPNNLDLFTGTPENVEIIRDFTEMSDNQLDEFRKKNGFAMSSQDIAFVKEYFKNDENRNPTITELKVIDTYWSDHCRHTTFLTEIDNIKFSNDSYSEIVKAAFEEYLDIRKEVYGANIDTEKRPICLMDMAVIGTKALKKRGLLHDLDESEEINACSIKVTAKIDGKDEDWLVMFKNETHNHPTEVEPFGGAATCLGGAIRDPLSGRVYVYQAMRVTGSGDPNTPLEDTMQGKLPQSKITKGAAKGYSSYGNQIGLATGQVTEIYDPGYVAKRMEVGAVVGAAPAKNVRREVPCEGDVIILVGGRTGRDGIGGATGSSKEHTEDSILNCGAEVQKGNPPVERNLQRLYRRNEVSTLIKRCNDFGAGGVSVAIGELADSIDVNLDLVPKKYEGLDGTELAISESQERMAVVVAANDAEKFIAYSKEENLEAISVAKVTDTGRFRMYWKSNCILDLKRDFLNTNGVRQKTKVAVEGKNTNPKQQEIKFTGEKEITELVPKKFKEAMADLNCASQKGLIENFDSTIGAATVLMPLGGVYQLSPAMGMAAKLPLMEGYTDTATLMTHGFDPILSKENQYLGGLYAVIDSATKIVAMGGNYAQTRLSFQEYFERLGENPNSWGKPFSALLGALKGQMELGIPAIGGKDSMSGTFMDINVPPTLISFAVAVADANNIISTEFKRKDSTLVFVSSPKDEKGIIDFNNYKYNMARVNKLIEDGKILSASTVGHGGIPVSLLKMAVGNKIGVKIDDQIKNGFFKGERSIAQLFSPNYGSLILEIPNGESLEKLFEGVTYEKFGYTSQDEKVLGVSIEEICKAWTSPLDKIFPQNAKDLKEDKSMNLRASLIYTETRNTKKPTVKIAKPKVFIPAFPGTNCEMDSKRAFDGAGADSKIQILRNLSQTDLESSIKEMEANIKSSQIIMLPGGFSGGDEPDGSAKFITAILRNPRIKEAVTDLLENRDGLILGICNGFQALVKVGLVPYGKIMDTDENCPTLTYNTIGRHISTMVRTRIVSVMSPWMANVNCGEIYTTPISHGEGRFITDEATLKNLINNGQIATQYVDFEGNPTMVSPYNPNGSDLSIEGITSPDGRIFGKMAHSERIGKNIYKNVIGNYDLEIFKSGVEYFK